MKLNWGWGIGIFYSLFVIVLVGVVYMTTFYKPDMVSADYYKDEQAFQLQIDKKNNTKKLEIKPKLNILENKIEVVFDANQKNAEGKIIFFRPSDSKQDKEFDIKLNREGIQEINTSTLVRGKWLIKLDWKDQDKEYYWDFEVFL